MGLNLNTFRLHFKLYFNYRKIVFIVTVSNINTVIVIFHPNIKIKTKKYSFA